MRQRVRCVAKYLYDHGLVQKDQVTIETGRGILTLDLEVGGHKVRRVRVDMGAPILDPARDPDALAGQAARRCPDRRRRIATSPSPRSRWATRTRCIYVDDVAPSRSSRWGRSSRHHPAFPRRVNVHVVEVVGPGEVRMRTWERGSGITLACGTGACAVCVAGVLTGRTDRSILAHLPGGDLELAWPDDRVVGLHDRPGHRGLLGRMARLMLTD